MKRCGQRDEGYYHGLGQSMPCLRRTGHWGMHRNQWGERWPPLRERFNSWWWRLFLSNYTSWRQDRAYRRFERAIRGPVSAEHQAQLAAKVAEGLGIVSVGDCQEGCQRHRTCREPGEI